MYILKVSDTFSAAHRLRGYEGKCENVHGHNWKVEAEVHVAAVNEIGISMDFKAVKNLLKDALNAYDHNDLNELPEFSKENPSAEHIARNIHHCLRDRLKGSGVSRVRVTVWESDNASCTYEEHDERPVKARRRRTRIR
jgi:6-pyruvoyltetrahydropterin/6-carboxytetrahydropterin synthase